MTTPIRALILEDSPSDAELMVHALRRSGFTPDWRRVESEQEFTALLNETWDVILADYTLPQFNASRALQLLQERGLDIPFVVVSGTIGEETAVGLMKQGAADYLLKDRPTRLGPAVQNAIEQKLLRDQRADAEQRVKRQLERLEALRMIDLAITSSLDLRVTLNVLLEQVTRFLHVDAADILLLNSTNQTLEYAAGRGFRTRAIENSRIRLGAGLAGKAALERRILSAADLPEMGEAFKRSKLLAREDFVSYVGAPLVAKGNVMGVLGIFHRSPLTPDMEWQAFLEALATQAAIAIDNSRVYDDLWRANVDMVLAYDTTLEGWARALELRDFETAGHSRRLTDITTRVAKAMGMGETEIAHMRRGVLLHDVGKLAVPDSILLKPGPLTAEEMEVVRRHPVHAYELLSPIPYLRPALDIPYCHHEKWDGTGYPRNLKGEQIPLAARIFAVADVWDALMHERPYKKAWPAKDTQEHIRSQAGAHFDPKVVDVFLQTVSAALG